MQFPRLPSKRTVMGKIIFVSIPPTSRKRLAELLDKEISLTELFNWSTWPLGIMSIESYLRKISPEIPTEIVDLNRTFLKTICSDRDYRLGLRTIVDDYPRFLTQEIMDILRRERTDIVALSALFDISLSSLETVATEIRSSSPEMLIVAGGFPCTNFADAILSRTPAIDAICLGEGEAPFAEMAAAGDRREYLETSPHFVTKTHRGTEKGFIRDINDIPTPDYTTYIEKYGDGVIREYVNVLGGGKGSFGAEGIVMTGRGCPFPCVFCAAHTIHGRAMRYLSLERVKAEIDFWIDNYDVSTINIIDDHFLGDVDRAIRIVDHIGGRGRNVFFANTLSFATVTREFVDCLIRNGVRDIHFALESGSARVLREIMRKPITLTRVDEALAMFRGTDIFVKIALLVGFPDETIADTDEALAYLRQAEYHWATISNFVPISGSELYGRIIKDSGVHYDMDCANVFEARYANPETVAHMLGDIKYTMNLDINFVHNPYMRMGRHDLAAERFESVLRSYPGHAFALYYLAKCRERLGMDGTGEYDRFRELTGGNSMWKKYAEHFCLL